MTRSEFDRLQFVEQINFLERSKLWVEINKYYHIVNRGELNDEVYDGIDFYIREFGWVNTMRALNRLDSNIRDSYLVYRYRFTTQHECDWCEFKAFNKGSLAIILDEFSDDDYYKELFEEEMNFSGVEELI